MPDYIPLDQLPAQDPLSSAIRTLSPALSSTHKSLLNLPAMLIEDFKANAGGLRNWLQNTRPQFEAVEDKSTFVREMIDKFTTRHIVQIPCSYMTSDQDGQAIRCSGVIILPLTGVIKNLVVASHYTLCANREMPSEEIPFEGVLVTKNYAVLVPDYIGFGISADHPHPYLHQESTARCVVDMLLAARRYLADIRREPKSSEVILMGYSQGGAATLAVQRLLEEEYADQVSIRVNFAGGGIYDVAATYNDAMRKDFTGIAPAIPMIVNGMDYSYHLGLDLSYLYKPELLCHYEEWLESKCYTTMELRHIMGEGIVSRFLTPQAMDRKDPVTARLYEAMTRSSLVNDRQWVPRAQIVMFHSKQDDVVPFLNAQHMVKHMSALGVRCKDLPGDVLVLRRALSRRRQSVIYHDFGRYGTHRVGYAAFLEKVLRVL